jgi:hypothetical protein
LALQNKQAPRILADAISKEMVSGITHVNVAQEYIVITEDRAHRCLTSWISQIESRDRWMTPVTLAASLTLTFVTSTFNDAFGMPKDTWRAVFIGGIFASVIWMLREVWKRLRSYRKLSVEDLIEMLKKGSATVQASATEEIESTKGTVSPN